jgi:hypothetical protein
MALLKVDCQPLWGRLDCFWLKSPICKEINKLISSKINVVAHNMGVQLLFVF